MKRVDSNVYIGCASVMARTRRPSKQMLAALAVLCRAGRQWHHGYDLMKQAGLSSGTLYPLLIRMSEQGLVEAEWREPSQPGRPARHAYRLTLAGLALAHAEATPEPVRSTRTALA